MTLKEKFDWYLSGGENCPEVEECEKIADDFAIGFADWFFLNYTEEVFYDEDYTKKQLEIYKKSL